MVGRGLVGGKRRSEAHRLAALGQRRRDSEASALIALPHLDDEAGSVLLILETLKPPLMLDGTVSSPSPASSEGCQ